MLRAQRLLATRPKQRSDGLLHHPECYAFGISLCGVSPLRVADTALLHHFPFSFRKVEAVHNSRWGLTTPDKPGLGFNAIPHALSRVPNTPLSERHLHHCKCFAHIVFHRLGRSNLPMVYHTIRNVKPLAFHWAVFFCCVQQLPRCYNSSFTFPGTPEWGCTTGAMPSWPFTRGESRAEVPLYKGKLIAAVRAPRNLRLVFYNFWYFFQLNIVAEQIQA